jgi:hypothetical protein
VVLPLGSASDETAQSAIIRAWNFDVSCSPISVSPRYPIAVKSLDYYHLTIDIFMI